MDLTEFEQIFVHFCLFLLYLLFFQGVPESAFVIWDTDNNGNLIFICIIYRQD